MRAREEGWAAAAAARGDEADDAGSVRRRGLPDDGIDLETPEGHKAVETDPRWRGGWRR
jgi:hypothetical protein